MHIRAKIVILSILIALCAYIILGTVFMMNGWGIFVRVALYVAGGAGIILGVLFFILKKDALLKTALVLVVCGVLVFTSVIILNYTAHLNELETDEEKMNALKSLIDGAGAWSMLVYVLVQILQVVILPLPAFVCYFPGTLIWGPGIATLLASAGVLIGSLICYFLGKLFGRRAVEWIAGKEATDKYANYLGKRGKGLFVIMQILPFFPDDILCLIAGLTGMNFIFFLATMIIVRPAIVATYCYLGSGDIIPFSGWGIPVWIAIFAVCIVLAVLSFKYQDKIESWLKQKFTKKSIK
ncbi:MAG: TVP38/TMEM64 family protein [Clostridiales bacterium]|nr:TVP38/TMEM64 family protein [Clostridiales bacterium]